MSFDAARPRYTLPFAGKDYELLGTMALIEAVEYALSRSAVQAAIDAVDVMTTRELSLLLSAVLNACGHRMTPKEAGDHLWDSVGLSGDANKLLRVHVYSFLSICLAPPEQREAKAKRAGELIGALASPGPNTSGSASAS